MKAAFLAMCAASLAWAQTAARPALDGVWSRGGGGAGGRGAAVTQWSPDALPFTKAGLEQLNTNKPGKGPRAIPPAFGNDPLSTANPPGLYRTLIYNRPFEIVQTPTKVVQMFEWAKIWRVIWTDGRPAPTEVLAGPYWYGYSVGKWEGDTLVVETLGLDERAWMDEWGTPFSAEARFTERWKRIAADKIELTITVTDPLFYEKPWTSDPKIYNLQRNAEVEEMIFAPIDEAVFNERVRDPAGGKTK